MKRSSSDRARDAAERPEAQTHGQMDDGQIGGHRFAVVAALFNRHIVDSLLDGAVDYLRHQGVSEADVTVLRVPGAWELPLALEELASTGTYDALIALGVVIRGETAHFDYICTEASRGCQDVSLRHHIPIGFGLLTTEDEAQALARAGGSAGNKGEEAAEAAVHMLRLRDQVRGGDEP